MLHEIRRTDEYVRRFARRVVVETPPILTIREEEVDPSRRWVLLEKIAEGDEEADARRPVVGGVERPGALAEDRVFVGVRASIPMGQVQDPLRRLWVESRENVPNRQPVRDRPH